MNGFRSWVQAKLQGVAAPNMDVQVLVQMKGDAHSDRSLACGKRKGPYFVRRDGLRCNFLINVVETQRGLELLSYSMHVEHPNEGAQPRFLRWEYSPDRKPNVSAITEPLAHVHPGHDGVRVPSPVLSPKELVTIFLALELWA